MKAVGIVGSPRRNGNTEILTEHTLKAIAEEGIETEVVRLAGLDIRPCDACSACDNEESCPIDDDLLPIYTKRLLKKATLKCHPQNGQSNFFSHRSNRDFTGSL